MSYVVDLQIACDDEISLPSQELFTLWFIKAVEPFCKQAEITVRIVDESESQTLNFTYRGKNKPTNVLSFPFEAPPGVELDLLGDLVICRQVVEKEAKEQNKSILSHWAHMIIHGSLHLLGFDHEQEDEADEMEALEIACMEQLGFDNPYLVKTDFSA